MTPLEKAKSSKTFCIYPWVHQYVGPPGDVKPCCLFLQDYQIGSLKENTLKEIWNNEATRQMRLDMLNGKQVKGCDLCYSREDLSKTPRTMANHSLFTPDNYDLVNSTKEDGTVEGHKLQYIDARFNNLCNLKCRTCGPRFSTSWIEDHVKIYNVSDEERIMHGDVFSFPGKTENQLLDEILPHLPNVKQIYFAGGEPLMTEDHYKILEELIRVNHTGTDKKPLIINYNTNFSVLKLGKYNALDLWKNFSSIRINASLDGSHERAEFWRKNTNWKIIENNRRQMMEKCPSAQFRISFTCSWVNVYNLIDFHREWVEKGLIKPQDLTVNYLDTPPMYSLKSIPTWKKKKIEKLLLDQLQWIAEEINKSEPAFRKEETERWSFVLTSYTDAIKFMYAVDSGEDFLHKEDFITMTNKLDKIRKENFWETFPEHQDIKEFLNV